MDREDADAREGDGTEGDPATGPDSGSEHPLDFGTAVFAEDGTRLGTVRGFDRDGFYVSLAEDVPDHDVDPTVGGRRFARDLLMWRCWQCGEMGQINRGEQLPDACPDCGADREDLYYYAED